MIIKNNLNLYGWINGISASAIVLFSSLFSIIMLFKAKRNKSKLLLYGSLMGFFAGMLWLGPSIDFFSILLTGNNLPNGLIYGLLTFIWAAPAFIASMYVGGELMLKENKTKLLILSYIIGFFYEVLLIFDLNNAVVNEPNPEGYELYDVSINLSHPILFLCIIMFGLLLVLDGIGTLKTAINTSGIIRKRFFYLSSAFFLFVFIAFVDGFLIINPIILAIVRFCMIFVAWLIYLSLQINLT
ncbi:MAG: hypothetical protein ACTSPW_15580 [Promethearchaeota archaeon]